jgi:hypothetical protein
MTDQKNRLSIGLSDSLPDVLNRLRSSAGTAISIEIPAASSLLLTASEFRALQSAADRDHITLSVATDDPLRQQLAAIFKLPVEAPEPDAAPETPEAELPPIEGPPLPESEPSAESARQPAVAEGSAEAVEPPSILRRGRLGTKGSSERTTAWDIGKPETPDVKPESNSEAAIKTPSRLSRATARARATTTRQRLIAAGSLVAVLVLAYLAAYLFLTRATVVLTLKRQPIRQDLTIAVAAPGSVPPTGAQVTIAATPVTFNLSTSQTITTTGAKTVGDAPAQGTILLSNPTGKPVTIEAGTQLEDKITGTRYAISATVEVVAGPNGTPGYGEAQITCLEPGTLGNRDVGLLSGQLPNGVYFANRESPISGGTDKQIPVVSQADLDALQTKATDDLRSQAAQQSPGPDQIVLAPTIQLAQPTFIFDHQLDQESPTLTVQATAQATALTYNPTELRTRVAETLVAQAPSGFEIEQSTLHLSDPAAAGGTQQSALLTVHADGAAIAALTQETRDEIGDKLAGDDEAAARTYLATRPEVESFTITYSPGWLPDRIPSSASRIDVEAR